MTLRFPPFLPACPLDACTATVTVAAGVNVLPSVLSIFAGHPFLLLRSLVYLSFDSLPAGKSRLNMFNKDCSYTPRALQVLHTSQLTNTLLLPFSCPVEKQSYVMYNSNGVRLGRLRLGRLGRPKHLHWLLLSGLLVAFFLLVLLTGVLCYQYDTKKNSRHSIFIDREANLDGACYTLYTSQLRRAELTLSRSLMNYSLHWKVQ